MASKTELEAILKECVDGVKDEIWERNRIIAEREQWGSKFHTK